MKACVAVVILLGLYMANFWMEAEAAPGWVDRVQWTNKTLPKKGAKAFRDLLLENMVNLGPISRNEF